VKEPVGYYLDDHGHSSSLQPCSATIKPEYFSASDYHAIEEEVKRLKREKIVIQDQIKFRFRQTNDAIEYLAFNHDGILLEECDRGIVDTTCPSKSGLMQIHRNNELFAELFEPKPKETHS